MRKSVVSPRIRERGDKTVEHVYMATTYPPLGPDPLWTIEEDDLIFYARPNSEEYIRCSDFEYIQDVKGLPENWYNPVFHEKFKQHSGNVRVLPIRPNATTADTIYWQEYSALNLIRKGLPMPPNSLIDDLCVKAELQFTKATNSDFSLINFIIELIEVIEGNLKGVRKLAEIWYKMYALFLDKLKDFRRSGHSEVASLWLAWNFAIKPTISDIKALINGLEAASKRLKHLQKINHRVVTMNFRRKDIWQPDMDARYCETPMEGSLTLEFDPLTGRPTVVGTTYVLYLMPRTYKFDFNLKAKVLFDIPDHLITGVPGLGTVWSAMQGLYNPEKIIWEAAPFSWLADYFVSERQKLLHELFDLSPLPDGVIKASGHSFSLKSQWVFMRDTTVTKTDLETGETTTETYPATVSEILYNCYVRAPHFPDIEEEPLRIPGWYQLSNLAALITQFFRRRD